MEPLPADVAASIVRGLGLYVRSVPAAELPKELRRFRSYRPATLVRHRDRLLSSIEDDTLRGQVLEWLDDARPKLNKTDASNLRVALERPPDWTAQLTARAREKDPRTSSADAPADLAARIAAERGKAKVARDELKSARREARQAHERSEEHAASLRAKIEGLSAEVKTARATAVAAERDARAARDDLERERRKARREAERAIEARAQAKEDAKAARKAAAAAMRQVTRLQSRVEKLEASAKSRQRLPPEARHQPARRGQRRRPLAAPKGLLGNEAQTLDEWLGEQRVRLLVDGYNVTKAKGGFGDLRLESQRERLIQELRRLALRRSVPATVVFDGSVTPPGTTRRARGAVAVEYSRPEETADDHLIALLEELPPDPVVVVTNDRELQARAAALGATIASSDQLLRLIR